MNCILLPWAWRAARRVFRCTAGAVLPAVAAAVFAGEPARALSELGYSGSQAPLVSLDAELAAARQDPARIATLVQQLLDVVRNRESTFASRQAACQRLGHVLQVAPAPDLAGAVRTLRPLLIHERDVDLARLALEPVPGEAVDLAFLEALEKAAGRARLGLIQAAGARGMDSAVAKLGELAGTSDDVTAMAAIAALGEIGGPAALAALEHAPAKFANALAHARLAAATRIPAMDAVPILGELQNDPRVPGPVQAAAFRTLLDLEPAVATARIVRALGGGERWLKEAALDAIADLPGDQIVPELSAGFADWEPATQIAVLAVFARKGDAAAVTPVRQAAAHEDAGVRQAALLALGFLPGDPDIARQLAQAAATGSDAEAKAARESLTRLNGPEVTRTVMAGAEQGDPSVRIANLEQLALRGTTEAVPMLLALRRDPDVKIRTAAVAALGELGSMAEQRPLLEWAADAKDEPEQNRAIRALVDLTLRNPAAASRGAAIYAAIENAPRDLALRLTPALGRLGGAPSAECAARLGTRDDSEVAHAAVATLGRWTDDTALPSLATVAERTTSPAIREAAMDAALRHLERNRQPWSVATTKLVSRLFASGPDLESRRRLVALLNRADDKAAIPLARKAASDPALGAAARDAVEIIQANLAGPPVPRSSGNQENVKNILDGKTSTRWSIPAAGDEWLELDFRRSRPLHRLILDQTGRASEFPERYEVFVTDDRRSPGVVRASGAGQRTRTVIELPQGTRGRYVIIRNTAERSESPWTVCELYLD